MGMRRSINVFFGCVAIRTCPTRRGCIMGHACHRSSHHPEMVRAMGTIDGDELSLVARAHGDSGLKRASYYAPWSSLSRGHRLRSSV